MHVEFEAAARYLIANVSGAYSLQDMRRLIDGIAQEASRREMRLVLVDVSSMTGDASIADRYDYSTYAASVLGSRVGRIAACAGTGQRLEPFTEDVAQNRGLKLRVFRHRNEAVNWLSADVQPSA